MRAGRSRAPQDTGRQSGPPLRLLIQGTAPIAADALHGDSLQGVRRMTDKSLNGDTALVFVEVTAVEEVGLTNENDLGIWNDAQAESFKPLIAFMKRQGTAIGIQIGHG